MILPSCFATDSSDFKLGTFVEVNEVVYFPALELSEAQQGCPKMQVLKNPRKGASKPHRNKNAR